MAEWEIVLVSEVNDWFVDLTINDSASAMLIETGGRFCSPPKEYR